jgi:hypothetical protein
VLTHLDQPGISTAQQEVSAAGPNVQGCALGVETPNGSKRGGPRPASQARSYTLICEEPVMTVVIALMSIVSMPALVILLVVVAGIDRIGQSANRRVRLPWRKEESGRPLAASGIEEMHAIFYAAKRRELDRRRTSLMLRDEEADGAPPHSTVDLDPQLSETHQRHLIIKIRAGAGGAAARSAAALDALVKEARPVDG